MRNIGNRDSIILYLENNVLRSCIDSFLRHKYILYSKREKKRQYEYVEEFCFIHKLFSRIIFDNGFVEKDNIFFKFCKHIRIPMIKLNSFFRNKYNILFYFTKKLKRKIIKAPSPKISIHTSFCAFSRKEYSCSSVRFFVMQDIRNEHIRKERFFAS